MKMLTICEHCQLPSTISTTDTIKESVVGYEFAREIPCRVCLICGEKYYRGTSIAEFELHVAVELALNGIYTAESLKFMRRCMGLTQQEMALAIGAHGKEYVDGMEKGLFLPANSVLHLIKALLLLNSLLNVHPVKLTETDLKQKLNRVESNYI